MIYNSGRAYFRIINIKNSALFFVLSFCAFYTSAQNIYSIAGSGTFGSTGDGSSATAATMTYVYGIAADSAGNIYISDRNANRIRRISTTGIIYPFAGQYYGSGYSGDGGPATAARIGDPYSIASDMAGNVFICDQSNFRVRKVNTSGIISTFAGTGVYGHTGDGGPATAARINNPCGIAVDKRGNVFIGDGTAIVRKVSNTGIITTVAGSDTVGLGGDGGPATNAKLANASSVAVDTFGNLYIADRENHRIRKVDTAGIITTFAGRGATTGSTADGVAATTANIYAPSSVATDNEGNVYITTNNLLRRVNTSGIIYTIAGNASAGFGGDGGAATAATFDLPQCVVVHGSGDTYIADYLNYRIRKIEHNHFPVFTYGPTYNLSICENAASFSINSLLSAFDPDTAQRLTWRIIANPTHGTLTAAFSTISGTTTIIPPGMYYAPSTGYSGTDSFSVLIDDGWLSDTLKITLNIIPILHTSPITGDSNMCIGTPDTCLATPSGGYWTSSSTAATVSGGIVHGVYGGYTTITYTVSNACSTDTSTFNIAVHSVVTPTIAISGASSICSGTAVTFTAGTSHGGTAPYYRWRKNGVYVGTDTSVYTTSSLVTGDYINCNLASNDFCITTLSVISNTITMSVTPTVTPSVSITGNDTLPICVGTSVALTAHPVNGGSAPVIRWYKMGALVGYGLNYSCIPANMDIVTCKLTSNATCPTPPNVFDTTEFWVNELLTPYVTISAAPTTISYYGQIVAFSAEETYGGSSPSYQWYLNGFPVSGATSNHYAHEVYENDTVFCSVVSNAPCIIKPLDTSNVIIILTNKLSADNIEHNDDQISLFPNPNNGTFYINGDLTTNNIEDLQVTVFDITGRTVYTDFIKSSGQQFRHSIKLKENTLQGVYALRISNSIVNKTLRFVVEK